MPLTYCLWWRYRFSLGDDAQRADSDRARWATAARQAYQAPSAVSTAASTPAPAMDRVRAPPPPQSSHTHCPSRLERVADCRLCVIACLQVKHHLGSSISFSHEGHERQSQQDRQATATRQQYQAPQANAGPPPPARNSRSLYSSSISFG